MKCGDLPAPARIRRARRLLQRPREGRQLMERSLRDEDAAARNAQVHERADPGNRMKGQWLVATWARFTPTGYGRFVWEWGTEDGHAHELSLRRLEPNARAASAAVHIVTGDGGRFHRAGAARALELLRTIGAHAGRLMSVASRY